GRIRYLQEPGRHAKAEAGIGASRPHADGRRGMPPVTLARAMDGQLFGQLLPSSGVPNHGGIWRRRRNGVVLIYISYRARHRLAIEQYLRTMDAIPYSWPNPLRMFIDVTKENDDEGEEHADRCGCYGSARRPGDRGCDFRAGQVHRQSAGWPRVLRVQGIRDLAGHCHQS